MKDIEGLFKEKKVHVKYPKWLEGYTNILVTSISERRKYKRYWSASGWINLQNLTGSIPGYQAKQGSRLVGY